MINSKELISNTESLVKESVNQIIKTKDILAKTDDMSDILNILNSDSHDKVEVLSTLSMFVDDDGFSTSKSENRMLADILDLSGSELLKLQSIYEIYSTMEAFNRDGITDFQKFTATEFLDVLSDVEDVLESSSITELTEEEFNAESLSDQDSIFESLEDYADSLDFEENIGGI
jgi:hypothetical protein